MSIKKNLFLGLGAIVVIGLGYMLRVAVHNAWIAAHASVCSGNMHKQRLDILYYYDQKDIFR